VTAAPAAPAGDLTCVMAADHPLRTRVRAFLEREVLPYADEWEARARIPPAGWRALAGAGLLEPAHRGPGFLGSAVLLEELGRTGYAGIRAAVGVHAYMAASYLAWFGTPRQRAHLAAVHRGERIAALAMSEAGAGTDLRHLATRAEPDGAGGYRVTGCKLHVANGSQAGFYVCLVRLGPRPRAGSLGGLGLLLVDAGEPGVTATPEPMLGWRAADICRVEFDGVRVPADALLGRPRHTLTQLMQALEFERLVAGLLALGGAAHCIGLTGAFARAHRVNGAPLSAHQAVRHTLADLAAELDLVRHYAYHAAARHSRGLLEARTAAILKLRATELAVAAARACMQYHGAQGYADGSTPSRLYRDAAAGTIAAGASELLRDIVHEATEFPDRGLPLTAPEVDPCTSPCSARRPTSSTNSPASATR
jgi:acyl-CoA dehydrogenase